MRVFMDNLPLPESSSPDLLAEIAALRQEVDRLALENTDLRLMLEMTTEHADAVTDDLQDLTENLLKRANQLEASSQVAQLAISILNLSDLLPRVTRGIGERFGYYFVGIFLRDDDLQALVLRSSQGPLQDPKIVIPLDSPTSIVVSVCYSGQAYLAQDVTTDPNYLPLPALSDTRSELALPLRIGVEVIGVLDIQIQEGAAFEEDDIRVLQTLADQIAIAYNNAQLYATVVHFNNQLECQVQARTEALHHANQELVQAYEATLEGWALALELRDQETVGHARRVVQLTERLASHLGIDGEDLVHIRRGALLHDIGKMGVPDSILLKPGPLDAVEWQLMRRHPRYAYDMLSSIPYLRPALQIPYCHHERWDGSGYPRGLAGEAIPLAARLFAVVDVWDALTSNRPYRAAWTHAAARTYLKEQAGKEFDPAVVDAFLNLLAE